MNETINAIMTRSSIRKFKSVKLNEEQMQTLIKAALAAPSAANRQPWHFNFVEDSEIMLDLENYLVDLAMNSGDKVSIERLLSRNKKVLFDAPLIVFVTSKLDGHFDMLDCGIAIENTVIAAQSLGLSSVVLGGMRVAFAGEKKEYYEEKFKFPKGNQFVAAVAIGYADMNSAPHALDQAKVTRV